MSKVTLSIYPPLSYKITAQKVGALLIEQEIDRGETLGDLLARLENSDHEAWSDIVNAQTSQIQPVILIVLNDTLVSHTVVHQTTLSDGDQIILRIIYSGG